MNPASGRSNTKKPKTLAGLGNKELLTVGGWKEMPGLSLGIPRGEYPQRIVPAFAVGMATAFAGNNVYAHVGRARG